MLKDVKHCYSYDIYHLNSTKGTYFLLRNHREPLIVGCTHLSTLLQKIRKISFIISLYILTLVIHITIHKYLLFTAIIREVKRVYVYDCNIVTSSSPCYCFRQLNITVNLYNYNYFSYKNIHI